ncbi:hypothetical protein Hanom_Chr00s000005g01612841 [Helianthus anomalus]
MSPLFILNIDTILVLKVALVELENASCISRSKLELFKKRGSLKLMLNLLFLFLTTIQKFCKSNEYV